MMVHAIIVVVIHVGGRFSSKPNTLVSVQKSELEKKSVDVMDRWFSNLSEHTETSTTSSMMAGADTVFDQHTQAGLGVTDGNSCGSLCCR
eukprot:scaffold185223_cov56-Cyclotella_meneghiniana.AAC.1